MAIIQISVIPIGTQSPSVSPFIAECVRIVHEQGLTYEVTSMGTEVEGGVEELLKLAAQMHRLPFAKGAKRVVTDIRIDERRDKEVRIGEKKEAVLKRLKARQVGQ